MHVRTTGDAGAPAVVLIHGQLLDGSIWDALAARLARARRVFVPDLPGYGASPPLSTFRYPAVREELERELAGRGVLGADVVGYSAGCWLALALTLEGRIAVRRLFLLGAVAGLDADVRAAFEGWARAARTGADIAEPFLQLAAPPLWAARSEREMDGIRTAIRRVPRSTLVADLEAAAALPDLRPRLGLVRCAARLRVGSEDRNTPPAWSRAIAEAIPGAHCEIADGIGHLYLAQDFAATAESIERFLADGPPPGPR
jgi:pimeloyl-ACP methyl ester carboxylesterase